MKARALFGRIARLCDLPGSLGAKLVRKALNDVSSSPEQASRDEYVAALPALRARMLAHAGPQAVEERVTAIATELQASHERQSLEDVTLQLRKSTARLRGNLESVYPLLQAAGIEDDE